MIFYKGKRITVEEKGGSHDESVKAFVGGLEGFFYDDEKTCGFLKRRSPSGEAYSTARKETDEPIILSGISDGKIVGNIAAEFKNADVRKRDYENLYGKPRPSHADITRYFSFGELNFDGGGEFSGRTTVALAFAGAICLKILEENYGVKIKAYLSEVGNVKGKSYTDENFSEEKAFDSDSAFLTKETENRMKEEIEKARADGDSVGAKAECLCVNVPRGLGGSGESGLESKLSSGLYAIPGVKGVEVGDGFEFCKMKGSEANDGICLKRGEIAFETNRSGGINGGISNGDAIRFKVAFRPTPSIAKRQKTVDLPEMQETEIAIGGRHDACFAVRAVPLLESVAAIVILDEILSENSEGFGGIDGARREIDKLDDIISEAYLKRCELVRKIGELKKINGASVEDKNRERKITERLTEKYGEENRERIENLYGFIFSESKNSEEKIVNGKPEDGEKQ